jgi:DNA-binding winged helix-turn-helix (wHTH) protein/TolB-like protein
MNPIPNDRYLFGGFNLDLAAGRFFADEQEVVLRPKSFALLSYLVRHAGRVVPKDELMTELWPDVTVTDDSLTQCVRDVRRALGVKGSAMLRTLPRRGYMLDAVVTTDIDPLALAHGVPSVTNAAAPEDPSPLPRVDGAAGSADDAREGPPRRRLGPRVVAGALAVMCLAVLAVFWTLQSQASAALEAPLSLAIVRFANLTGDPGRDFIASGFPNTIASMLGSSPLLRYTDAWLYHSTAQPGGVTGIAADLGVDLVLDGSIGVASSGLAFSGTLHDGISGEIVSPIRAEAPDGDFARLQYLIARAVADEVAALTGGTADVNLDPGWGATSASPNEYSLFLHAQTAFAASLFTGEDDALRLIDAGLTRYPQSVPLRLLKAEILTNLSYLGPSKSSGDNAQAAWAILSDMPEASTLPLMERWHLFFVRASVTRLATGDFQAGMRDAEAAYSLVPHAMSRNVELAVIAADAGHGARAVEWVRGTINPDMRATEWQRDVLAWALLIDGRPEDALAEFAQIQRFCLACKVVALVRTGQLDQARNMVETMGRETPWITIAYERNWPTGQQPFLAEPALSAYLDDLRKAGLPETGPPPP